MPSLRSWMDNQITAGNKKPKPVELKANDQVVIERNINRGKQQVKELMAGTIVSFNEDKSKATITMPRAGGRILRTVMPVNKLRPASEVFGRARVQTNPAFRQIVR